MADEEDYDDEDDEREGGVFRWMSAFVVLLAIAGFFGLAWYAYKNGGETVNEKDVELIKADKTPVKEAPANPGGMQIPNQDKTVYGLVSGKNEKPVVERILPAPEEPLPRSGDTQVWMSDSAKTKKGSDAETVKIAPSAGKPEKEAAVSAPAKEQFNPAKAKANAAPEKAEAKASPVGKEAASEEKASSDSDKEEEEDKEAAPEAKPAVKAVAALPPNGARAQLGAYKSQGEADGNWAKIARKFPDDTRAKQHYVVRADLGAKGVFYRLQVAPFASPKEAEAFCMNLVSAGQGCFLAKGK